MCHMVYLISYIAPEAIYTLYRCGCVLDCRVLYQAVYIHVVHSLPLYDHTQGYKCRNKLTENNAIYKTYVANVIINSIK